MASRDRQRKRLCKFQNYWIDSLDSEYSSWLFPVKNNEHKAHCTLCNKTFNIGHGGLNDVKLHCKGKKHFELYCKNQIALGLEVPQLENRKDDLIEESLITEFNLKQERLSPRLAGECSPPQIYNVEAELSEGGDELEFGSEPEDLDLEDEDPTPEPPPHVIEFGLAQRRFEEFKQRQQQAAAALASVKAAAALKQRNINMEERNNTESNNMAAQQYCLRWKYHHNNLQVMFSQLLERECFCDVTLASEGRLLRAHKVVLSACSTYFDQIFSQYEEKNPIVILKDVKYDDIKALVEFMYRGEINVEQSHLASLLKTAEELKVKGLAEVSWRADEAQAANNSMHDDSHHARDDMDEPAFKRQRNSLPARPSSATSTSFKPRVTSVVGAVGTKDAFVLKKAAASPYVDLSMVSTHLDEGQMGNDSMGSDYDMEQPEMGDHEDSMQSNGSLRDGNSERGGQVTMSAVSADGKPAPTASSPVMDERTRELFKGVVKMNDYLVTGRRQQFWEEPFMRRLMDAIKNKEVEMKLVAEVLGVSYGTLYGRYRDTHGCLKHPYRLRDFWNEPGPSEVILRLRNKELTLNEAADMLNVSMNTLTSYVASMPPSLLEKSGESSAFAAAARLPPDITATPHRKIVKEEPHDSTHSEMGNGNGNNDNNDLQ